MKGVKKLSELLNLIIVVMVVALGGAFFYFRQAHQTQPVTTEVTPIKNDDEMVNKYLQQAVREREVQKMLSEKNLIEARNKLAEIEKRKRLEEMRANESIPLERQIWKENKGSTAAEILDQEIQQSAPSPTTQEVAPRGDEGEYSEAAADETPAKPAVNRKPTQQDDSVEAYPLD